MNYRPEYRHGWGNKAYYRQLRIDALPAGSAHDLLASLLGKDASLASIKRTLVERTEGNPFFVEETVRTLVETVGAVVGALTIARWRVLGVVVATLLVGAVVSGYVFDALLASRLF